MQLSICFTIDSIEFTPGVLDGTTSLGGSESACVGLARALRARGHDVHIFSLKLAADVPQTDHTGVQWHPMDRLAQWAMFQDWDVAIALRQPDYLQHIPAKFRVLWCQDLMASEGMKNHVMALAWTYDAVAYVSKYHQRQWEDYAPELKGLGWDTKNGHDAQLAAEARKAAVKKPRQIIHISRPERGLVPLLEMWPALREADPQATLALCRYSSMYDPQGWGAVCKGFDADVEAVNKDVGGITFLGELGKPALYKAIAESAVMWYPGISTFAETSCIAAIEAQACGTPFVGSFKGALPETVPGAVLIRGKAEGNPEYQRESVAAVVAMLRGCQDSSFNYRQTVKAGLRHVEGYTYDAIAAEWEAFLLASFRGRYEANLTGILRRLDHDDDLVNAKIVADELGTPEAEALSALADRVGAGAEHTAEHYAKFALKPHQEIAANVPRHTNVVKSLEGCRHVIDVACGNGSMAIMLAQADPARHVTAVDFSPANIEAGRQAAIDFGVAAQITWVAAPVWDLPTQQPSDWLTAQPAKTFDGLVCGEFLEHVTDCTGLINALERVVTPMGRIVFTVPMGPLGTLVPRQDPVHKSHVHHFRPADLTAIFGQKDGYARFVLPWANVSGRGESVGNWLVSYRKQGPTGVRPVDRRRLLRPYQTITAGLIVNNTLDLRRCLDAIWPVVDEIVLGDTGCPAGELDAIALEFPRKTRVMPIGDVSSLPGGFSEARNRVLEAATGEWFLWIDADEILCGPLDLGKYLDGPVFQGYAIAQNHLQLDAAMGTDLPIRVFRKRPDVQFYGCVHEQPQAGDCNGEILPCLQVNDVQIAHTGYLHEAIRRDKCLNRNLPLLVLDQQMFPDRLLGKLLLLRDHANLALWDREKYQGQVTDVARHHYQQVVGLFEKYFIADPTSKMHKLGRPFYEQALKAGVAGAIELEGGFTGRINGLGNERVSTERVWVRTPEQLRTFLYGRIDAMLKSLEPAPLLHVEPLDPVADAQLSEMVDGAKAFAEARV